MKRFKQNIFLLTVILILTSGCIGRSVPTNKSPTRFVVGEITGRLHISEQSTLPTKFIIKLQACIRSHPLNTPLPFTEFAITHHKKNFKQYEKNTAKIPKSSNLKTQTEKEVIQISADSNSCLHWTEEFDYAYNNQSEWIKIDRYIKGLSPNWPGTTDAMPLAINPWLQLNEYKHLQVVDYRKDYGYKNDNTLKNKILPNGLELLKSTKQKVQKNKVNLIIQKVNFFLHTNDEKDNKRIIKAHISAEINYTIADIFGNYHNSNRVSTGDFIIKPGLLVLRKTTDKKGEKIIKTLHFMNDSPNKLKVKTRFENAQLTSDTFTWNIPIESYISPVTFFMQVIPKNKTAQMVRFNEGFFYTIGESFSEILGNQSQFPLEQFSARRHQQRVINIGKGLQGVRLASSDSSLKINNKQNTFPHGVDFQQCVDNLPAEMDFGKYCINPLMPKKHWDLFGRSGWRTEKLNIRFSGVLEENWLYRKISTIIEASIKKKLPEQAINLQTVNIRVIDLATGEENNFKRITEPNGNISFNVSTSQYWYKKQRYFLKIIYITSKTKELLTKRIIAINPWDYGFTHGFEINQPNNIRAICSTKDDLPQIGKLLASPISELQKKITPVQMNLIHKIFCHNTHSHSEGHFHAENETTRNNWIAAFGKFSKMLQHVFRVDYPNRNILPKADTLQKLFDKKFISIDTVPAARSYIHLFRSINKYPTLMVDHSLHRDLFYNMRIKVTPRIVRMDSLHKGQQDKGPLRDGVYLFQMALLKNNQERQNGKNSMVSRKSDYSIIDSNSAISNTSPIYTCLNSQKEDLSDCVVKDDFLIPPVNLPVIVRDGIIRTDIKIPMFMENLLFANSKNLLIFRVIPADPDTVVCKNGSQGHTCTNTKDYELALDWKQTLKKVRPAKSEHYSMYIYTYKTPLIPSEWINWNIAGETNMSFSNLNQLYDRLSSQADYLKAKADKQVLSEKKHSLSKANQSFSASAQNSYEQKMFFQPTQKEIQSSIHQVAQNIENITHLAKSYSNTYFGIPPHVTEKYFVHNQTENNNPNQIKNNPKEATNQTTQTAESIEPTQPDQPSENIQDSDNTKEAENKKPTQQLCPGVVIDGKSYSAIPKNSNPCTCISSSNQADNLYNLNSIADNNCSNQYTKDLTTEHLSYFAEKNSLCVIPVGSTHSDEFVKACGKKHTTSKKIEQNFIKHLNKQIYTINQFKNKMGGSFNEESTQPENPIEFQKFSTNQSSSKNDVLSANYKNSSKFRDKLKKLPTLPAINSQTLENIIHSEWSDNKKINPQQIAFMHALCGFWFENFYTDQYLNKELLASSFKRAVRKTFYYKVRGLNMLPEDNNFKDSKTLNSESINQAIEELKISYEKHLFEMQLKGYIDNVHRWIKDPEATSTDFQKNLSAKFENLSKNSPFVHNRPSWEQPSWFNRLTNNSSKASQSFQLSSYLNETNYVKYSLAGFEMPTRQYPSDFHPVRKCINNPSHFFGFEKKIIVGKTGQVIQYSQGEQIQLNLGEDFLINSQRDQGSNQDFSTSMGSNFNLLALPLMFVAGGALGLLTRSATSASSGLLSFFSKSHNRHYSILSSLGITTLFAMPGAAYNYRSYTGTGKRKLLSYHLNKEVELNIDHSILNIHLKKYQQCLLVRPRMSAFEPHKDTYDHIWSTQNQLVRSLYETMGMLICSEGKNPHFAITEDYYYIYPNTKINSITIDPSNYRNKPFVVNLRGKNEYHKFVNDLSCYLTEHTAPLKAQVKCRDSTTDFDYLLSKHIEFVTNLRHGFVVPKLFHTTQQSPGVYSPPHKGKHQKVRDNPSLNNRLINWFAERQMMDSDIKQFIRNTPPEEHK